MRAARSSPWPISRRTHTARPRERRRSRCSPIAIEVVRRIDALFAIERSINGKSPEERLAVRRAVSRPLVDALMTHMRERAANSKIADQQAINSKIDAIRVELNGDEDAAKKGSGKVFSIKDSSEKLSAD